jgi:hypothetical protein
VITESQRNLEDVELDNPELNDKILGDIRENIAIWDGIKSKILTIFDEEEKASLLEIRTVSKQLTDLISEIKNYIEVNKRYSDLFKSSISLESKMKADEYIHLESAKNMAEKFLEDFERVESQKLSYNRFRDRYNRLLGENDFSHTSSFYEINSDVDEHKSVNSVFYLETQLVLLKEKYSPNVLMGVIL